MRLFSRRTRETEREIAPQLTQWDRTAFSQPGIRLGQLPYETYDEMQRDSMVQTVLTLKRLAVLAAPWRIEPADPSPEAAAKAEFAREALVEMEGAPEDVLGGAMDAFAKGWSVQETVYREANGRIWLQAVRPKDPAMFGLVADRFGRIEGLRLRVPGEEEVELPRGKFVLHIHRRGYGQPRGKSDLDAAHRHWLAKQTLLGAWKVHLEKYAMPTVLGRYERGLPSDEQSAILRALREIQNNAAVVCPNEIEVSLLGGDRGPSTGFQEAIEFHNREIARAVLGQTLTTDEGRRVGSLALGKVHLQILMLQIVAIRRELAETVMTEQLLRPLVELNFGPGKVPRFRFDEPEPGTFVTGAV